MCYYDGNNATVAASKFEWCVGEYQVALSAAFCYRMINCKHGASMQTPNALCAVGTHIQCVRARIVAHV